MTGVRLARMEELDALLDLVKATVRDLDSQGIYQWDEIYPDRPTLLKDIELQELRVIEVDGRIAGMIAINEVQSPGYETVPWSYHGRVLVVHRLIVDPRYQRQKLGSQLMDCAEREAAREGYDTIRLDAFTENPAALAFYKGRGYRQVGTVPFRKGHFHCFEKAVFLFFPRKVC